MAVSSSWYYNWEPPVHLAPDYSGFYAAKSNYGHQGSTPNNFANYIPFLISLGMLSPEEKSSSKTMPKKLTTSSIPKAPLTEKTGPFRTVYRWKTIDFAYETETERLIAKRAKEFIPQNNLPLGVEVYKDRIFISFPKWKRGVPVTLGFVPTSVKEESPNIMPYPDWTWQSPASCYGFTSVYRMQADTCGRLWVLDSGQINVAISPKQVCPPAVYIFDLKTDDLLLRYEMPESFIKQDSLFSNIVVDIRDNDCGNAHAYITDVWRFGLVVFNLKTEKSWRIYDHLFYPDPLAAAYELHNLEWEWTDGVFGIALSPINKLSNDRILYYHPMSSFREFYSYASIVQNETSWMDIKEAFRVLGQTRGKYGQASASAMDRKGVLFYNLVTRNSVGCWDSGKAYKRSNLGVVAYSNETLIFPNDLKIDNESRQSLWILSNRLPYFLYRSLDYNDYNFRIMTAYIDEAIRDGICNPSFSYSDSFVDAYDDCYS